MRLNHLNHQITCRLFSNQLSRLNLHKNFSYLYGFISYEIILIYDIKLMELNHIHTRCNLILSDLYSIIWKKFDNRHWIKIIKKISFLNQLLFPSNKIRKKFEWNFSHFLFVECKKNKKSFSSLILLPNLILQKKRGMSIKYKPQIVVFYHFNKSLLPH